MCLTVKKGPFVAKKNIMVFKNSSNFVSDRYFNSEYSDYEYTKNSVNEIENLYIDKYGDIDKGYHSYPKLSKEVWCSERFAGIFLIPKGSEYYEGLNNAVLDSPGIVSSQLIYKGKLTLFNLIKVGIDRKNNDIGYKLDNCVSCCSACNFMKHKLSLEVFKEKISKINKSILDGKI